MADNKPSSTIENYLSLLFIFERDGEPVVGARLAEQLRVTPPTVTNTLKRMCRDGLVELDDPNGPKLTDTGREAASSVMRRHILTEWVLAELLSWAKIHTEAHELEHGISQEVEDALQREWDYPEVCPHGNPLPGHEGVVAGWFPLTDLPLNRPAVLRRVHELGEETPGLLEYLEDKGLTMGGKITVTEVLPFNQTLTVQLANGEEVSIGLATAKYLHVELE